MKLIVLVSSIPLISVLVSTLILFNFQRRQIIQNAEATNTALSNTIKANIKHAMISVDQKMKMEIMQSAIAGGTITAARILDARGVVSASSIPEEVGDRYTQLQPACQSCHASQSPPQEKTVIFVEKPRREVLLDINLLENEAECQVCHAGDGRVLGVLMLETPLDAVQKQLVAGYWRTGFLALGTFIVLVSVLGLALRRYVIEPVEKLEKGVAEISSGNFDRQIQIVNQDELGRLAQSLDTMRKQLRASQAEMETRNQELAALNELALTISQSLDLQDVLKRALETVLAKLNLEAGLILLTDPDSGCLTLRADQGVPESLRQEIERRCRAFNQEFSQMLRDSGKTCFLPKLSADDRLRGLWDHPEERSFVLVPLRSKMGVFGAAEFVSPPGSPMSDRTVLVIEAMANEISIAVENALLLAEAHRSEQEALTLSQLGTPVSSSLALQKVINAVAEGARELLAADIGLVGLMDGVHPEFILKAAAGMRADQLIGIRMPSGGRFPESGWIKDQPVIAAMDDPNQPIVFDEDWIDLEYIRSCLTVPLARGERILGLIQVMTKQQRAFTSRDAQLLTRLARHMVVAIENAQLYRQLRYLAVLEERDRIAGEMHDHLSQTLGYINVRAAIIENLMDAGQVDAARESLSDLKDAARIAYTDVREAIFNLRTSVPAGVGLLGMLQEYLKEYQTYYGLDARLCVEDEELVQISPEVAAQLLRIIQEALANVRKHAAANKVRITCRPHDEQICFTIEDNGQGFSLAEVPGAQQQHFGLQIMRERAESVGGSLELVSQPGQGTRVIVCVPGLNQTEEEVYTP